MTSYFRVTFNFQTLNCVRGVYEHSFFYANAARVCAPATGAMKLVLQRMTLAKLYFAGAWAVLQDCGC